MTPDARLLALAVAALARREHSRAELERTLRRALQEGEQAACIVGILDRLQARGLLSDARMAQGFARARAQRYGRRRIAHELEQRGVDQDTIAQSLPSAEEDAALAHALWQRKFGTLPATPQERARQGRFLAARGFDAALVARILRGA